MHPVAEEMKPVLAFLERELPTWPQVEIKPMFGMWGVYRGKRIFAALPRSRAVGTANSILCKLPREKAEGQRGQGWRRLEIFSSADLRSTLDSLHRAHEQAGEQKKKAGKSPASKRKPVR
jgi:TfoX/Sxy family transcriptional regulator of competence genes